MPMPTQHLGRYEIVSELGRGAMGVVYKALDPLIERTVAIKCVSIGMSQEEAEIFEKRFYREAKSAGRLNHPNIVTIYDVGKSEDQAYIAMELLEGQSLRDILDSGVVLPPEKVADIAAQIADGLAFAHQNDIVHRDIKPANIMVLNHGVVKITDFGIALLPTGSRTMAGTVFGSPKYISPEQIMGKEVDGRSDIFALGAVVYEMLTGVPPFTGADLTAILYQVINEMPPPPTTRNRNIAPAFDRIIAKAMAKDPEARYQKVQDMAADLRNYQRLDAGSKSSRAQEKRIKRRPPPPPPADGATQLVMESPTTIMVIGDEDVRPTPKKSRKKDLFQRKGFLYGVPAILLTVFVIGFLLQITRSRHNKPVEVPASVASETAPPSTSAEENVVNEKLGAASVAESAQATIPTPSLTSGPEKVVTAKEAAADHSTAQLPAAEETKTPGKASTNSVTPQSAPKKGGTAERQSAAEESPAVGNHTIAEKKKAAVKTTAVVSLAVSPWGEVYVDGKQQGISPPLRELNLPVGKHIIEIRNTGFPTYQQTVDLKANIKVKHKFQ